MAELLTNLTHWSWWTLAIVLVVLEIFVSGTFFLWMGISALVVGVMLLVYPALAWEYQLLAFAILSVASIVAWLRFGRRFQTRSDQPALNRRGEQYIGRSFVLDEPIVNGYGKIRVDDTTWRISGTDSPAQSRIEVIGVDGVLLKVKIVN